MLKLFLLPGWLRLQPFLNYFVLVMLIAPILGVLNQSTSAKPSKVVTKNTSAKAVATMNEPYLVELLTTPSLTSLNKSADSMPLLMAAIEKPSRLQISKIDSLVANGFLSGSNIKADKFTTEELATIPSTPVSELNLWRIFPLPNNGYSHGFNGQVTNEFLSAKSLKTTPRQLPPFFTPETPVVEEIDEAQAAQIDPIGSPHPIPWQWIVATQEAVAANGGSGVRHYRSVPVTSPDGRYVVYSRVQLEVKPQMHNSKVTSVLFVEDRQTKKLRVMTSSGPISDPLLNRNVSSQKLINTDDHGKIGVLVPVSWSEQSDRFLARRFEGKFNTGDSTDQAVIWDSQKNHINTVAPTRRKDEHEKIAVLLGWSKNKPDHALFRAGEIGEENWPLVQVSSDGKTLDTTDGDQPITFGKTITELWAGPQVAFR